ncbi:MAG TPA: LysR family transcriptional regulator [Myxococcaceae bacterium]|jgi:DNA-binding transcriptional LysR family regulator
MDLEELRAFLDVVETGSYLAAADSRGVSRTTLRRRVEALEARAGVPLLKSTPQGIVLTEAGEVLSRRGRIMMQETSALLTSIREVGQAPSGLLRLVVPVGLPPQVFALLFGQLRTTYPLLRVHVRFSDDPLNEPLDKVDMAFHFGGNLPRGPWLSYAIIRVHEGLLATKDYLRQRGVPRSVEELRDHELFAWEAPGEDATNWPSLRGTPIPVQPALVATDIHIIRSCCLAGMGIALIPSLPLPDPGMPEELLVPVLPDEVGRERPFLVSVPEALAEIPKIKLVLGHLRRALGQL